MISENGTLVGENRTLHQCQFVRHKSHVDFPGTRPGPPWRYATDKLRTYIGDREVE
jgi:hypothetical protein